MKEGEHKETMSGELSPDQQHLEIAKQQLEIYKETLKAAKKQADASVAAARATWLAALAAILVAVIAFWPLVKVARSVESTAQDVKSTAQDVKSIEKAVLSSKLVISSVSNGEQVSDPEVISGFTPYPTRNHYLVITPLKVGDSYVQERATVRADGTWTGNAKFGSGDVGVNEKFTVRCLATEAEVRTGSLASQPLSPDAIFSSPVTVTRTR